MALTIRQVLDKHFEDVKFDRDLCKRIIDYTVRYMNRNEDHSAFFGGVLLGVQEVRFYDTDREIWFDDVLRVDDDLLRHDFVKAEGIDPTHIVASDPFNHIPGYLTIQLNKRNDIPLNIKQEAITCAFMVLHFKYLTSLLVRRFKYPARREVAEATFAALNYKFDIKAIGSWGKLIRERSEGISSNDTSNIYYSYLHDKIEDKDGYMSKRVVTDTQSRIRELINKYYEVYIRTLQSGSRLVMTSDIGVNTDGDQILRDKVNGYSGYLRYMHGVVNNEQNFIRPELLGVIENSMAAMPPKLLVESLQYMSRNYGQPRMGHLEKLVDECLLYAFDYMQSIKTSVQRNTDLNGIIVKIRAKLMASRSEDPRVLFMRDTGEAMVKEATKIKNPAVIAATRTGIMLYIILRAMTRNYYSR
ncbi:hypothetical protein [Pseudomonas phage PA1C]|uniref:Uncharacterized protein n=1 Tax=Pseudomonas phage vB_PaeM_PS119XW TaxID=2601632 RepID=A0A5C1K6X1_9CAUD|nr:hypothetical protein PP933_gp017 [Pseudomonas phage vB_PaeM_PS119XW]QBX32165.1 hypothetical protein [Pseudomonas phage PA1C]QEM41746.1 hypothetical protein [Pseudomonas phage vB_PaeM_PS119XW]BEG72656.1 hypothetical protein RVBP21_2840 [Pseudomonas phage BRkr]